MKWLKGMVVMLIYVYYFYIYFYSDHAKFLQNKIDSWNFSPFELNHQDLIHCVILMFKPVLASPDLDHLVITLGKWRPKLIIIIITIIMVTVTQKFNFFCRTIVRLYQ